jgi:hypothetical protein
MKMMPIRKRNGDCGSHVVNRDDEARSHQTFGHGYSHIAEAYERDGLIHA